MLETSARQQVHVGAQGRLVIPAKLRHELDIHAGDAFTAHTENGRLILEKAEVTRQRLKARFAKVAKGRSLASELITERRLESRNEN